MRHRTSRRSCWCANLTPYIDVSILNGELHYIFWLNLLLGTGRKDVGPTILMGCLVLSQNIAHASSNTLSNLRRWSKSARTGRIQGSKHRIRLEGTITFLL